MGGWAWGARESDGRHQEGMLCGGGQGAGEVSSGEVGLYGAGGTGRWKEEGGNSASKRGGRRTGRLTSLPILVGAWEGREGLLYLDV